MFLSCKGKLVRQLQTLRYCSTTPGFLKYEKDPAPFFIDPKVQSLLKSVTGVDFTKVLEKRANTDNKVALEFMTPEKLQQKVKSAMHRARHLLQMPPVVQVRAENIRVLSENPDMADFSDSNYVIADISFDLKDTKRTILVRKTDGTLETASLPVRKRISQIYVPRDARKINAPKMFEQEFLQRVLEERQYEFILDRACVQFEPFEQEYHDITAQTYQHIDSTKSFHDLRSTRHFGTMTFFLAWHKMIDNLLLDCLKRGFLRNAVEIIALHHKLHAIPEESAVDKCLTEHPDTRDIAKEYYDSMVSGTNDELHRKIDYDAEELQRDVARDEAFLQQIEEFTKSHAVKKVFLEAAIQTCREEIENKLGNAQKVEKVA